MIYTWIHTYNGNQQTVAAASDKTAVPAGITPTTFPDGTSPDNLTISNGSIVAKDAAQLASEKAQIDGAAILAKRQQWYSQYGDVMKMQQDRGVIPAGTWEAAVAAMQAALPYPSGYTAPNPVATFDPTQVQKA